jgi:hypothetical protein
MSDSAMSTSAMRMVGPIPSRPTERPLKTLVTRKASPCTVPTMPFAFACLSTGTSSVTVVESAMLRSCSTTAPASITTAKIQNHGWVRSAIRSSPSRTKKMASTQNTPKAMRVAHAITAFLRNRSTRVPNIMLNSAMKSM